MVPPVGPVPAKIMLVGEAPGEQEVLRGRPFVGMSGSILDDMLHEAGIMRSECFITNVARERPPDNDIDPWFPKSKSKTPPEYLPCRDRFVHPEIAKGWEMLQREIVMVKPNVIVAFGNVSLWALTGKLGIKSWRGSYLTDGMTCPVIPIYHPAYIMRDWSARAISVQDLKRAAKAKEGRVVRPNYQFIVRPNYEQVSDYLSRLLELLRVGPTTISCDIETRSGHIACIGLATSAVAAICIPFMCVESEAGYWPEEHEYAIVVQLKRVLTHPNARVIGQNFIYDSQYFYRHWGYIPNFARDTMLGHHCCFAGLPKGLDYLSSMYCEWHEYWKDEGKEWNIRIPEEQYWGYNCKDSVITFECDAAIQETTDRLGLRGPHDFQQSMFWPVLQAMVRGIRVDTRRRNELDTELHRAVDGRNAWLADVLGHPINVKSPKQMAVLFYEDFAQKKIINRKSGKATLNDEALQKIGQREPILRPLVSAIAAIRSLGVFLSTFVEARLDSDGRLRCSFNIAGTETFRLSSSENAFGSGTNFQNIPEGDEDTDGPALPNIRKIFIPDDGYTFFDADLSKADAQVVAWEADDHDLKQLFREGHDLHKENAKALGIDYKLAKRWVHGTNYGGKERTMAASCGLTIHRAEAMRRRWFQIHPGIAEWQKRVDAQLRSKHAVTNIWGYRRHYFDRIEGLLPEALAWIGQSTVAIYINKIWMRVYEEAPAIQVLLQVHDSLAGQWPTGGAHREQLACIGAGTVIPFADPLVIPLSITTSTESWGACA